MQLVQIVPRHLVILMGPPGSGKSTVATTVFKDYTRINQDELGSRQKCIDAFRKAIEQNKAIVVDRCNISRQQRKVWTEIALGYGSFDKITCVYLDIPDHECVARIHERKNHPNITSDMSLDKKREIVGRFFKEFEMPSLDEGFSEIIITRSLA